MFSSDIKARYILADTTALDADGVCASQTPASAGNLTINGAQASGGVASFTAARQITIASSSNISNRTFTITGTDAAGNVQVETITGPNNTTVTTARYFRTVTQIAISGSAAGALTVGMNGNAADVIFAGRMRLRGAHMLFSNTGGVLTFREGSATGTTNLQMGAAAAANVTESLYVPQDGILFVDGGYFLYTVAAIVSITIFYA
jgi:hypothetical protein